MPPRKSVLKLQELCWKTTVHNFKELQTEAESLPLYFTYELYKRICKIKHSNLPSKLFLHFDTPSLLNSSFDLQPQAMLIEKISRDCNNLRRIVLPQYHTCMPLKSLINITMNNPLLVHLDINNSSLFTDGDLYLISNYCPQLQHLNLRKVRHITDTCVDHLPITLTFLDVKNTDITSTGCVVALKRLPSLKQLNCHYWDKIFKVLWLQKHPKPTYSIECLKVHCEIEKKISLGNIIVEMFPKLCDIRLTESTNLRAIRSFRENQKLNLITCLRVCCSVENVIRISKLCEMLETLVARISSDHTEISNITELEYVPFKHLRKLTLRPLSSTLTLDDFKFLLMNFKRLESLNIYGWRELTDRMIYVVLKLNLQQRLESIAFNDCGLITSAVLRKLLISIDSLKFMKISNCENILVLDCAVLQQMILKNNWDVSLSFD